LQYKLKEKEEETGEKKNLGSISINANRLITDIKTIIKTSDIEYKDILNYTFAIVENKIKTILFNYHSTQSEPHSERQLINSLLQILEFVFFIYAVSPKINTTIKLCRIIQAICEFLIGMKNKEYTNQIHKLIFDEISFVIKKNTRAGYSQIETLYLLIALSELGKDFWLEEVDLIYYLGIDKQDIKKTGMNFNYFSLTVSLFYMKKKKRYREIRKVVEQVALQKIESKKDTRLKDAEITMLTLDMISCPYINKAIKLKILSIYGINGDTLQNDILDFRSKSGQKQLWFTNWENFNFGKELDAKQSQEVY
jgi:hypothetical protein